MSIGTILLLIVALAVAVALGVGIAYVPMRLIVGNMARNVRQFIQRQRDRRAAERGTPDRRKV